jgi:hypothetical protein
MKALGLWHDFNPKNLDTYPQVEWPVRVRFVNDLITEGECEELSPGDKPLAVSLIQEWRYIRETESFYPISRKFGVYDKRAPGPEHPSAIFNAARLENYQ